MISFSVPLDVRYAFAVVAFVARVVGVYYFAAVGLISVLRNESDFKFLYTHKYTNTHNRKKYTFCVGAWMISLCVCVCECVRARLCNSINPTQK